ncbi:MAG: hypothetical protein JWQ56_3427 [Pseudarthrobacter sp.]|jgi:hypothetical protein|nr:hypothetical protein [Pseudarthrobacter sp.]
MGDSPHGRGTGKDENPKKHSPADAEDVEQEESGPEDALDPEEAPRPPRLYGYDPDQWPEPN